MSQSKIKINVLTGEVEIEGEKAFVETHLANIASTIKEIRAALPGQHKKLDLPSEGDVKNGPEIKANDPKDGLPDNFGEWLHHFPKKLKETDKILIAGYFAQKSSTENSFKTSDANKLLTQNGIKLSNAAVFLKELKKQKLIFQVKKDGKLILHRVSQDGEEYLNKLKQKDVSKEVTI